MSETEIISSARAAWSRIERAACFADWLIVAKALAIGREHALRVARTNKPFGKPFVKAISTWLREHGLDRVSGQERHKALQVLDHEEEITAWRAGLPPEQRRRLNHPSAILAHWRASLNKTPSRPAARSNGNGKHGTAVHWPQAFIARAAEAIHDARSNDCYVLARRSLEAAVRGTGDLHELLADTRRPVPTPRRRHNQVGEQVTA